MSHLPVRARGAGLPLSVLKHPLNMHFRQEQVSVTQDAKQVTVWWVHGWGRRHRSGPRMVSVWGSPPCNSLQNHNQAASVSCHCARRQRGPPCSRSALSRGSRASASLSARYHRCRRRNEQASRARPAGPWAPVGSVVAARQTPDRWAVHPGGFSNEERGGTTQDPRAGRLAETTP